MNTYNPVVRNHQSGFTLIEILVVIGLIAVLATVVLIAINPGRQFAQARNSERTSEVNAILNAIGQRMVENRGVFEGDFIVDATTYTCPALTASSSYNIASVGGVDLSCLVPTYLSVQLPVDPNAPGAEWQSASDYNTQYRVSLDATGRFTVSAPAAELGATISITR